MELKTSSKGSKPSVSESIDIEALEGLVDEYGNSLDPDNNSIHKNLDDNSQPPLKLLPSPVKNRQIIEFQKKEYDIGDMRVFIMDSGLYQSQVNDLVCFEL